MTKSRLFVAVLLVLPFVFLAVRSDVSYLTEQEADEPVDDAHFTFRLGSCASHEEDMNLSGYETLTIQDCEFNVSGIITVEDNATLVLKNAHLMMTPPLWSDGVSLIVKDSACLSITDCTVVFNNPTGFDCKITIENRAEANISRSTFVNYGFVLAHDSSTINMDDSNITIGYSTIHNLGVVTYDVASAQIRNSMIDGVFVWDNSTMTLLDCDVGIIRTALDELDATKIYADESMISSIETGSGSPTFHIDNSKVTHGAWLHCNTSAQFTSSSIAEIHATGNATILLVNSSAGSMSLNGSARISIGLAVPLIGLVTVPYEWVPAAWIFFVATIVAVVALLYIVHFGRKKTVSQPFE